MLRQSFGAVRRVEAVGGGDTSAAVRVQTENGELFVKWGSGFAGNSYLAEADGLRALREAAPKSLYVPEVLLVKNAEAGLDGLLVMPWLDTRRPEGRDWQCFGESLALLHQHTARNDDYGWYRDNFLGLAPQCNESYDDWPDFFGQSRLAAMRDHIRSLDRWRAEWDGALDALIRDLPHRLPAKPHAALVHGDLWRGNTLCLSDGRFALIDPAVYAGHAEVDLAMTHLFGGFPAPFYEGYASVEPVRAGAEDRRAIYQLYHLMMHLAVSEGYGHAVGAALAKL